MSPFSLAWLAERRLGSVAACASLPGAVGQRGLPVGRDAGMVMAAVGELVGYELTEQRGVCVL